jgi:hypothetical protein
MEDHRNSDPGSQHPYAALTIPSTAGLPRASGTGFSGFNTGRPRFMAARATGVHEGLRPRPARLSGLVTTASI